MSLPLFKIYYDLVSARLLFQSCNLLLWWLNWIDAEQQSEGAFLSSDRRKHRQLSGECNPVAIKKGPWRLLGGNHGVLGPCCSKSEGFGTTTRLGTLYRKYLGIPCPSGWWNSNPIDKFLASLWRCLREVRPWS